MRRFSPALLAVLVAVVFSTRDGCAQSGGPPGGGIYALAIDPSSPATVYAGTSGGVFKSTNEGLSWTAINSGLVQTHVSSIAIDPTNSATIYAGVTANPGSSPG